MRPSFSNEYGGAFLLIEPGNNFEFSLIDPIFVGASLLLKLNGLQLWAQILLSSRMAGLRD